MKKNTNFLIVLFVTIILLLLERSNKKNRQLHELPWMAPDTSTIPHTKEGQLILYGRDLIAHTARYLGPEGIVKKVSNGMNCQNCHLAAGTVPWGNNYSATFSTYPKFKERSGTVESIEKKINDCLERSLNGAPIDNNSQEMRAMAAYMRWLGKNIRRGNRPAGSGILQLHYPDDAADSTAGALVYQKKCAQCHGISGEGKKLASNTGYQYPPLWGKNSFNCGASMYRLTKIAGFIKSNMPLGASYSMALLSDKEAWDVAAFIISQPRPEKNLSHDWPDIRTKPIDHPFGPFPDTFPALQHKYGPFGPIQKARIKKPAA